ncbi:MAG: cytochrome c553 [Oleiphilaceae bacterium]|jgi:cytochrome c553
MKTFLKSVVIFAGIVIASGVSAAGNIEAGKNASAICAGCHGADGNSVVPNFPKLAGQGEKYLLKQLNDIKTGKRAIVEMTGILDAYSDQDMENLAAYYAAQMHTVGQAKKDLVDAGEVLYRVGNPATKIAACAACHGPSGNGIDLAGFPMLSGQHADYIASQLKMFRSGKRDNDGDTRMMRSVAALLSDKEIEAVSSYISGLN